MVEIHICYVQYLHPEANKAQGRRNWNFKAIVVDHQLVEFTGQFDLTANVSPQSFRAVSTHYKPEFQ